MVSHQQKAGPQTWRPLYTDLNRAVTALFLLLDLSGGYQNNHKTLESNKVAIKNNPSISFSQKMPAIPKYGRITISLVYCIFVLTTATTSSGMLMQHARFF